MSDERLINLIEDVLGLATGKRVATKTAQRLAEEIIGEGYIRADIHKAALRSHDRLEKVCVSQDDKIEALEAENKRLRDALWEVSRCQAHDAAYLARAALEDKG